MTLIELLLELPLDWIVDYPVGTAIVLTLILWLVCTWAFGIVPGTVVAAVSAVAIYLVLRWRKSRRPIHLDLSKRSDPR